MRLSARLADCGRPARRTGDHSAFIPGDNRSNSEDGRYWGMVPEANLVGRAFLIWFNWDSRQGHPAFGRIGTVIH